MQNIDNFSKDVQGELGYYVYGLIDPRNGRYFYIGKGVGNRVFQHIKGVKDKDEIYEQINTIKQIHNAGLEVIHIIIRHGLRDEEEALSIESTLIDFIGLDNLDNKISGINMEKGINNAQTLQKKYSTEEFIENKDTPPFIIIKITQKELAKRDNDLYETCRKWWKISLNKAEKYKYALCVLDGIVIEVFEVERWYMSKEMQGRCEFDGKRAEQNIRELFVGKRIPEHYRKKGNANPIQYSKSMV